MGRRKKAAKKAVKKKRPTVPKTFKCCRCNHEDAVECIIDVKCKVANLNCRLCGANYESTRVSYLTDPIDVFCEWIDSLEDEELRARAQH
mmetsp:Transcript_15778/g.23721  ORF Transcript_15778/g.23721 Transcript_15778/m.23721 type:complete len:90 (-) Transcript_15778:95-364(-)